MNFSEKTKNILGVILLAILGGGVPVFGKVALQHLPVFTFIFSSLFFAVVTLFIFARGKILIKKENILFLFLLSIFSTLNFILFAFGIQKTDAIFAQAISTLNPIFTLILSLIFLKREFKFQGILGVTIGLIGAFIVIFSPVLLGTNSILTSGEVEGNIFISLSVLFLVLFNIFSKKIQRHTSTFNIVFFALTQALIVITPLVVFEFINGGVKIQNFSINVILSVMYVGVLGTAFYYLASQRLIKKTSPVFASLVLYLQPFSTILLSFLFLNEHITISFVVGLLISLLGVFLVNKNML